MNENQAKEELKDMKVKTELKEQKNYRVSLRLGEETARLGELVMPFETPKDQLLDSRRRTKPLPWPRGSHKRSFPSSRQRTSGWNKNILIFSPIIGIFPKGIYTILVFDQKMGRDSR